MSQQLFIDCSGHPSGPVNWIIIKDEHSSPHNSPHNSSCTTTPCTSPLAELPHEEDTEITCVFSGLDALLLNATMPTRNLQKVRQALPYLFEEQLIDDAETLHFAIGTFTADQLHVAVIAKNRLQEWLDALAETGLQVDQALIDTQLLNYQQNRWVIWCDEHTALVRTDPNTAFACDRDQLLTLLNALPEAAGEITHEQSLHIFHNGELDIFPFSSHFPDRAITAQTAPVRFQFLTEHFSNQENTGKQKSTAPINLLQGEFARKKNNNLQKKWAAIAASIALLLVVGSSALLWYKNTQLGNQYTQLQQEMASLYKSAFPNSTRVVDPKVQMKVQLKKLQGSVSGADDIFKYLALLAQTTSKNSAIEIQQIRYQKNSMELKFETESLQVIEKLKDKMTKKGVKTSILSANKEAGRVKARVKLEISS